MANNTAQHAVDHVTNGESSLPPNPTNVQLVEEKFFD